MTTTERIIEYIATAGGITNEEADLVLQNYRKYGVVKVDGVSGGWSFTYGEAAEKKTILGCLKSVTAWNARA